MFTFNYISQAIGWSRLDSGIDSAQERVLPEKFADEAVVSGVMPYFDLEAEFCNTAAIGVPMAILVVRIDAWQAMAASDCRAEESAADLLAGAFGEGSAVASLGAGEYVVLLRGVNHFPELLQILEYAQSRTRDDSGLRTGRRSYREHAGECSPAGACFSFKTGIARCPLDDEDLRTLLFLAGTALDELHGDTPDYQFVDGRHRRSARI